MRTTRLLLAVALIGLAGASAVTVAKAPKGKAKTETTKETSTTTAAAGGEVVARIGDRAVTLEEVDAAAMMANMQAYQKLYEARRAAVDQIVADAIVDAEAASLGLTKDQLIEREVTSKIQQPTDEEIAAWYEKNKAQMGNQSLDVVKDRIRGFLGAQRQADANRVFMTQLKQKHSVHIALDAPRTTVAVANDEPAKGPATAPVKIVAYSEFQCPFCSRVGPTIDKIVETYGDRVQVVFRDFPLPMHNNAAGAAQAAQCAHEQGKFWEYHDKLFANQRALAVENLKQYAKEVGLDATQFDACLDSGKTKGSVDADVAQGQKLGVQGTPAFFINGRFLSGAQPFEAFQSVIDEELESKGVTLTKS